MSRPDWKRTERSVAARLGGQRVPVSGRARGDAPDIAHPRLALEVKHRKTLPAWLLAAMRQVDACAEPAQTPVAVLHQYGSRHAHDLCVLWLADLQSLLDDTIHPKELYP
jgi:hypothetical protein